jgi:mono/diheme cytochrome c family protein
MIVDFYRGVIQDRASTTMYLKDYIQKRSLDSPMGVGMGRIWRVMHETTKRDTTRPQLSRATPAQLVQTLSHPNGWWRDTAQRLLVERGSTSVTAQLVALATGNAPPRTKVKALWVLDGNDSIDVATLTKALADPSRDVRMNAVRIAERWLSDANHPIQAAVLKLVDDPDWNVREQLAASLGVMPPEPRAKALASLLQKHANDPVVMDAAMSGMRGTEMAVLETLLQTAPSQTPPAETAIAMIAATLLRSGSDANVQAALAMVADANRPAWQRAALLLGAEIAVIPNTPMPGNARRGAAPSITTSAVNAAGAPCPTCPGGRAGPGGAYAFRGAGPADAPAGRAGGRGRGGAGGGPRLSVSREPSAFAALASAPGDLQTRATNVLARIDWPGKPGAASPVAPLTAAEQQRFDAGREVYRNVCQACHQPDGRGLERVAPPLVGSVLALAPAEITTRILLNGKEGPVGLMPPIGSVLNDDQIASVLTYVRREWGQTGDPVDPATVRTTRAQTTDRQRPWTHDELLAMLPGRGQ